MSPDFNSRVRDALAKLDGTKASAVSLLTGLPPERLDELGGFVAEATTLRLERRDKLPVTLNIAKQSRQMYRLHDELKDWRAWAKAETEGAPPIVGPVAVTVTHLRKTRASMPDCGAPILAAKACIDGLVDAGILPGDGPDVVTRLTFLAPQVVGYHGLRLTITPTGAPA